MRIAIDIDGVLRDTFTKIEHLYQKYFDYFLTGILMVF